MTPFLKRNLLIPVASVLLIGILYLLINVVPLLRNHVQHLELLIISLLILLTLAVKLFWVSAGAFAGLGCFLVSMIFIYRPLIDLNPYYYGVLILAFFVNSFLGQYVFSSINKFVQSSTVKMEKIAEDKNLIEDHYKARAEEIEAMEYKINSLLKLKEISDKLSLAFSIEEVVKEIESKTYEQFSALNDVRVAVFLVDEKQKELKLYSSFKADTRRQIVMKKGGIFERWVMKNMQSLLVKDVSKDFRFSIAGEEGSEDFISLISKPIISESKMLGILRVDSKVESAFAQHELRILDIIGELSAISIRNANLYKRTEELAIKDSLTGLFVHKHFMERLDEEVKRAIRSDGKFALMMLDIDEFKEFNDKNGHIAGDIILKNVSAILESKVSPGDIVGRYGGEEFTFLALNCGREKAVKIAKAIKEEIKQSYVTIRREKKSVTASIGVAVFPEDAKLREEIIWEADKMLYKAKAEGKDRICSK